MNKPFIEIDAENFTLSAFETKPIEGYEVPTNKETGEQFPNCCPIHKSVFERAESWFSKFPNCCEPHKEFNGKWWFNKENYNGIAEKIVKQLSYTEHHISERIKKNDWYKDITDYIEYNISSFGHPAVGLHLYLGNVKHYIQNTKSELNKEQRQRLIEFIEGYYKPSETEKTDLNILNSTYQKWLKEFPFELNSYFGNLKQHFEKQLPILNGKPEVNIYSGIAKAKMHTKSSLIEALINLTNSLLTQINGVTLYEMGLITDANKIKLELVINSRKLKLKQGYKNSSPNEEQRYRKILKEWFKDEKKFIDEIAPLLKALPPQQTETKTDKLKVNQIALIHVYEGVQITRENAGEIAAKHGYTAKNSGEGLFQDYTNYGSTANRKGKPTPCTPKKLKNKIELFESVVSHLSDNNKQRAIDEINILKTIFENEYQ